MLTVFAVHCVDETGKPALVRPSVPRAKLLEPIASLPPCLIGMEACSGAHHWAREFAKFGHTVRLMAPKFVIPYRLWQTRQERCGRRRRDLRGRHPTQHALRTHQGHRGDVATLVLVKFYQIRCALESTSK